jgi:glucosamine kinase
MVDFLIGVDGGGSGTRAMLARRGGPVLAEGEAGPSALGQGIAPAWTAVLQAIRVAFERAGIPVPPWKRCALAAGLSGVSNPPWRDKFVAQDKGFGKLIAETDSFVMLVGAHAGRPGLIVAAGTGSIGEVWRADGSRDTANGWGFPVGDEGSGAWLGLRAVSLAQCALDGRMQGGPLVEAVLAHCGESREALQAWCDNAGQFAYAQLAPLVFETQHSDPEASQLLDSAARALDATALALDPNGALPLVVCGSIGQRLVDRLSPDIQARCVAAAEGPAAGALTLIRRAVDADHETLR